MCEAFATLGVKCRNAGFPVPATHVEIIALAFEDIDTRARSAPSERARLRSLFHNSEARVASLERELFNFQTVVSDFAATKSALEDKVIAAETRLKDVNDVRTVRGAHLRALETELTSLRRQYTHQAESLTRALAATAQL